MILLVSAVFIIGYIAIALEHNIKIDKAASALMTGVLCWTLYILNMPDKHAVTHTLTEHLGEIAEILFFLLGAMTIVELIDAHDGFQIIVEKIKTQNAKKLLWIVAFTAFFFSALLDNLTTTIVMVSLVRKIIDAREMRLFFAGIIVIAANAGGVWSPIGDVTTTMLWIGNQVTATHIIMYLFLPSLTCLVVPLLFVSAKMTGEIPPPQYSDKKMTSTDTERKIVFWAGLGALVFVPIFKTLTHLPPFMAMLLALSVLWMITEKVHHAKNTETRDLLSVANALQKIDTPSILFFLGILISIAALQTIGILGAAALWLSQTIGNDTIIGIAIGLLSAVVDNVPIVAAVQGMYSLAQYPTDAYFWTLLTYTSGTGGSALIIGSAAGVAAMGIEKIDFFWYFKRISWLALIGYFVGVLVFLAQYHLV